MTQSLNRRTAGKHLLPLLSAVTLLTGITWLSPDARADSSSYTSQSISVTGSMPAGDTSNRNSPITNGLRPDAPRQYRVQPGDTLWDISAHFLKDPWLWPQLWQENPQVEDPDLIYPGDLLELIYDQRGQPRLQRRDPGVIRLSPGVRVSRYREAVPAIPLKAIEPFIERHQVFSEQQVQESAYVLGAEDSRIVTGVGDLVYVRHAGAVADGPRFLVYRQQKPYIERPADRTQGNDTLLGIELKYIATLEQQSVSSDVAVMKVIQAREEIRDNDLVTLQDLGETPATFYPSAPSRRVQGEIISVLSGVRYGGTHTVVAINLGKSNRLVPGNVLTIRQKRAPVKDRRADEMVQLPSEVTGRLMVFRTFRQVSYALVMEARKPIGVGDTLVSPDSLR